jgi:predicted peptidase
MGNTPGAGMSRRQLLKTAPTAAAAATFGLAALADSPPVAGQSPAPLETGFINGQITANGASIMRYVVYVPRDYAPEKQWPVIMFLHGSGAGGGNNSFNPVIATLPDSAVGALGVPVMRHPDWFPCLVVWPQTIGDWSGRFEALALQALEEVVVKYNGDRNRLYLTGVSAGGTGTYTIASKHPALFAAAMPMAACGNPAQMAPALKSMPIWVFMGGNDSPGCARRMVAAIQAAGNPNVQYTEYPGVGHNCWDIAYNDAKVIEWLLAQKR